MFRAGGGAVSTGVGIEGNETFPVLEEVEVPLTNPVLYLRDDRTGQLRALFTHLEEPDPLKEVHFAGASEDFKTVFFEASASLLPGAPSGKVNNLYEWHEGQLTLVSVRPGEADKPETDASFGTGIAAVGGVDNKASADDFADLSNAVSRDGSRVFWTAEIDQRLYMTEAGGEAVQIDVPNEEEGVSPSGGGGQFWTATPDGSQAFFTDDHKLTSNSTAVEAKPGIPGQSDLYEYDLQRPEGERLVDLTVAPAGQHAGVQGVLGASENGSYVYFSATGVLAANENGNSENAQAGKTNLYEWHGGEIIFVAVLRGQDGDRSSQLATGFPEGDWSPLAHRTSEVTPSGEDVLFMSENKLTGYDNEGLQEAYVYDAGSGSRPPTLSCASCTTSGERPVGSSLFPGEGPTFLPPSQDAVRTMNWMSDDGDRVFFDSTEPLVPQATNGFINVYEWERDGSGECRLATGCIYLLSGGKSDDNSYLLDASASGDDVFISTRAQLVPEDQNEDFDLYDVRVGGATPVSPTVCTGTGCQGVPQSPPIFATPSTVTFEGLGNFPPPSPLVVKPKVKTVKCKKTEVRKHNKCVRSNKAKSKHKTPRKKK